MITPSVVEALLDLILKLLLLFCLLLCVGGVVRAVRKGTSAISVLPALLVGLMGAGLLFRDKWLSLLGSADPVPEDGPTSPAGPSGWEAWDRVWRGAAEWLAAMWPWLVKGLLLIVVWYVGTVAIRLLDRRVARALDSHQARRSEQPAQGDVVQKRLVACLARWERLREAYGALLMDPVRSLELQALFDLQVDQSRSFHRAWTAFDELARDLRSEDAAVVSEETLDRLETRAGDTENLWLAAQRHAERIGWTNLMLADQPRAARALGLLKTAQSATASTGERDNAWALAAKILAHLNLAHLPEPAVAAVTARTRTALTQGAGS